MLLRTPDWQGSLEKVIIILSTFLLIDTKLK